MTNQTTNLSNLATRHPVAFTSIVMYNLTYANQLCSIVIAAKLTLPTTIVESKWEVITIGDEDEDAVLPIVMSANTSFFPYSKKMVEQQPTTSSNALAIENIFDEDMDGVEEGQQSNQVAVDEFPDDDFFENIEEAAVLEQAGLPTINTTSKKANHG